MTSARCPLDSGRMFKRRYILIDDATYSDTKITTKRCQDCDAEINDYNGVPVLFNGHGEYVAVLVLNP